MKMLQLALALSLLQVDPDNYLYQRLGSWDSQLELRDGDGWELEMLRAVPMVEYPYANRKTMMPLIEDLVRFDRQHSNNQYNVTAYLLNVQGDTANQTAAMQELQATPTPSSAASTVGAVALEQAATAAAASIVSSAESSSLSFGGLGAPDLDLFLNSDHFQDQLSVWEQNLADLHDFGELPAAFNTYAGLPMKEEPLNHTYLDFHIDSHLPGFAYDSNYVGAQSAGALNDTFPEPDDTSSIKLENLDDDKVGDHNLDEVASCSSAINCVKKEEDLENDGEVDLSPFISQVELTKEVRLING